MDTPSIQYYKYNLRNENRLFADSRVIKDILNLLDIVQKPDFFDGFIFICSIGSNAREPGFSLRRTGYIEKEV